LPHPFLPKAFGISRKADLADTQGMSALFFARAAKWRTLHCAYREFNRSDLLKELPDVNAQQFLAPASFLAVLASPFK
jgi:hypothetical protein